MSAATLRDTDGDGAPDLADVDSDDDGILDSFEGTPAALTDTDGDGVPGRARPRLRQRRHLRRASKPVSSTPMATR